MSTDFFPKSPIRTLMYSGAPSRLTNTSSALPIFCPKGSYGSCSRRTSSVSPTCSRWIPCLVLCHPLLISRWPTAQVSATRLDPAIAALSHSGWRSTNDSLDSKSDRLHTLPVPLSRKGYRHEGEGHLAAA